MDVPSTEIRPLRAADGEAWRALRLQALEQEPASFAASFEEAVQTDPAEFARRIPAEGGADVLLGLFVDGVLEGAAGFLVQGGLKRGTRACSGASMCVPPGATEASPRRWCGA